MFSVFIASEIRCGGLYLSDLKWKICILITQFIYLCRMILTLNTLTYLFTHSFAYLLTYLFTPWSRVLLKKLTVSQLVKKLPAFMEPEDSLPKSQMPATCPYPEPTRSSPWSHIPIPEEPFYYSSPIDIWVFQVVSFSQDSPPEPCIHLTFSPYALHVPPISFFLIWSPEQYCVSSTDH
jgi:hypothetical protein